MQPALFAALVAALAVQGSARTDRSPGDDSYAAVAQYDPPLLRAQFLLAAVPGEMTSRSVFDMSLDRRQTCDAGYGYCRNFGRCCPTGDRCCSYGYCLEPGSTCCPNGPCGAGNDCCGYNHCHPVGTQCCNDERYCEAGNVCVKFPDLSYDVCCTDTRCTAYVTGGTTVTRTTTAPVETTTRVVYTYYYFYITWTYYVYYWYYIVTVDASVVTSSLTTTTTTVSVRASNSAAASSSFKQISSTFSQYTPASATSLKSLTGSTFTGGAGPGPTGTPTTTALIGGGGGGGGGGGTGRTTGPTGSTEAFGGRTNGASRVGPWANYFMPCFFSSAAVVGVLMVAL